MKKTKYILMLLLAIVAILPSCRRASHNGKLDGQWRITQIERVAEQTTDIPDRLFININLELVQLVRNGGSQVTGEISYSKGGDTLGMEFPSNPSAATLRNYGIYSNPVTFDVAKLDRKTLVLESPEAVIICERF